VIHSLRAFHHRNFRLFFLGQSLGIIGYWVQQIAMSWLVYRLTGPASSMNDGGARPGRR
jgi:hypothetical protein